MTEKQTDAPSHGLWRREIGRTERTLRNTFAQLAALPGSYSLIADPKHGLFAAQADINPAQGDGYWRFFSISDQIFCVITECSYNQPRVETVRDEGFVEFHFLLEGPVNLSYPKTGDRPTKKGTAVRIAEHPVSEATMFACRSAQDISYSVHCPSGPFRMIGLYVEPEVLVERFGFSSEIAKRLCNPLEGQLCMFESMLNMVFVRVLQGLRQNRFETRRDLVRAQAKVLELLCLGTDALDSLEAKSEPQVFSHRDLEMFEKARQILTTDVSTPFTISTLSRRLGTNPTKLKRGFKFLYGRTVFEFRKAHRMDRAMSLLSEERLSVAEVAEAVGYSRQASFTTAFKAHFGFLPKVARHMQALAAGKAN